MIVSLHFLDFANYRYMLYTENVSIFLDEENLVQLKAVLEKFKTWEALAAEGQMTITKTIDSIAFTGFYSNRTFFREPAFFYFIFTGSLPETNSAAVNNAAVNSPANSSDADTNNAAPNVPLSFYTLFVDTSIDKIAPFRLSSKQVQELLDALSPEKLAEAREAYEQQRALEELFN